jgi:hypothetical protein
MYASNYELQGALILIAKNWGLDVALYLTALTAYPTLHVTQYCICCFKIYDGGYDRATINECLLACSPYIIPVCHKTPSDSFFTNLLRGGYCRYESALMRNSVQSTYCRYLGQTYITSHLTIPL